MACSARSFCDAALMYRSTSASDLWPEIAMICGMEQPSLRQPPATRFPKTMQRRAGNAGLLGPSVHRVAEGARGGIGLPRRRHDQGLPGTYAFRVEKSQFLAPRPI